MRPPGGYFVTLQKIINNNNIIIIIIMSDHGPGPGVHRVPRGAGARVVELAVADIFILREGPIPLLVFRLVFPGNEIN